MSGYLPTCQQTKGERQRVPQSSDSRTLKPQPATPTLTAIMVSRRDLGNPHGFGEAVVMPVFNEINGLTTLQNYAFSLTYARARARGRIRTYTYCVML